MKTLVLYLFFLIGVGLPLAAQTITGVVSDAETSKPIAAANLTLLGLPTGTVTNSDGRFVINIQGVQANDSLVCSYMGYSTRYYCIGGLDSVLNIKLSKSLIDLSTVTIFATPPDAAAILERMLEYKFLNYDIGTYHARVFRREWGTFNNNSFNLSLKQSTLPIFSDSLISKINKNMSDTTMFIVDKLFDLYSRGNQNKKRELKSVAQLQDNLNALSEVGERIAQNLDTLLDNKDKMYWKISSGFLFSEKVKNNTIEQVATIDSLRTDSTVNFNLNNYADEHVWNKDFFTKPKLYHYEVEGGVDIAGESAFIIHFTPKKGKMEGRMYVSMQNYALLRLEYDKHFSEKGEGFSLFGVTYRTQADGCVATFQKLGQRYALKYINTYTKEFLKIKRPITLTAMQKRWVLDKTIESAAFKLDMTATKQSTMEYLVTEINSIPDAQFFQLPPYVHVRTERVKQYNDPNLWKGYSIIEPTEMMKNYRGGH